MVCADSKRATTVRCPPTFGLDGLLPAAVTMHDLTEKLQQRFCCASVAQSRSIGCDVPFSREERRDLAKRAIPLLSKSGPPKRHCGRARADRRDAPSARRPVQRSKLCSTHSQETDKKVPQFPRGTVIPTSAVHTCSDLKSARLHRARRRSAESHDTHSPCLAARLVCGRWWRMWQLARSAHGTSWALPPLTP